MRRVAAFLLLLTCTACYTSRFLAFSGRQEDWPIASHSYLNTNAAVPIYTGLPPRPYDIIGEIIIQTQSPFVDTMDTAARIARAQHADALLIVDEHAQHIGNVTSAFGGGGPGFVSATVVNTPTILRTGKTLAIKFR